MFSTGRESPALPSQVLNAGENSRAAKVDGSASHRTVHQREDRAAIMSSTWRESEKAVVTPKPADDRRRTISGPVGSDSSALYNDFE